MLYIQQNLGVRSQESNWITSAFEFRSCTVRLTLTEASLIRNLLQHL
ncbi:hypothetical protein [Dolichospermum sp. UHCC 0259]|nr:hypothetical protein [Dolichospermum sp. UHCC 0259]